MFQLVVLSLLAVCQAQTTTPGATVTTTPATTNTTTPAATTTPGATTTTTPGSSYSGTATFTSSRRLSAGRRLMTAADVQTAMCTAMLAFMNASASCSATTASTASPWSVTYTITVEVANAAAGLAELNGLTKDTLQVQLNVALTSAGVAVSVSGLTAPVSVAPLPYLVVSNQTATGHTHGSCGNNVAMAACVTAYPLGVAATCAQLTTLFTCLSTNCGGCSTTAMTASTAAFTASCGSVCPGQATCGTVTCPASRLYETDADLDENDEVQEAPAAAWALPFMGVAGMFALVTFIGMGMRRKSQARDSSFTQVGQLEEQDLVAPQE